MTQRQVERPQDRKPRPTDSDQDEDVELDIGDTDDILKEIDIINHPEKYSQEQRDCSCLRPSKRGIR